MNDCLSIFGDGAEQFELCPEFKARSFLVGGQFHAFDLASDGIGVEKGSGHGLEEDEIAIRHFHFKIEESVSSFIGVRV